MDRTLEHIVHDFIVTATSTHAFQVNILPRIVEVLKSKRFFSSYRITAAVKLSRDPFLESLRIEILNSTNSKTAWWAIVYELLTHYADETDPAAVISYLSKHSRYRPLDQLLYTVTEPTIKNPTGETEMTNSEEFIYDIPNTDTVITPCFLLGRPLDEVTDEQIIERIKEVQNSRDALSGVAPSANVNARIDDFNSTIRGLVKELDSEARMKKLALSS